MNNVEYLFMLFHFIYYLRFQIINRWIYTGTFTILPWDLRRFTESRDVSEIFLVNTNATAYTDLIGSDALK